MFLLGVPDARSNTEIQLYVCLFTLCISFIFIALLKVYSWPGVLFSLMPKECLESEKRTSSRLSRKERVTWASH